MPRGFASRFRLLRRSVHGRSAGLTALAAIGAAIALVLLPPAGAQVAPIAPGAPDEAAGGKENSQNVFVRDSAIAQEKFDNAQKMERQKQWNNAASFYQEVLEKYADRVVPFAKDKDDVIIQYTSISNGVRDRLCHWPAEGLDVYRSIYEPKAAALLDAARKSEAAGQDDSFALHEILRLYFVTETAKSAAIRLIDEKFDRGEFNAAAWLGDEMLNQHPNLLAERPAVLFRTALAYHLAGNKTAAEDRAAELTSKYPGETGHVGGRDMLLTDALRTVLAQSPEAAAATSSASWPMFGGNPQRDVVPAGYCKPGTRVASIPLARPDYHSVQQPLRQQFEQRVEESGRSGATMGVMPVCDRGELYFQDGLKVYAVDLESGAPLPGWARTYNSPPDRLGQYVLAGGWGSTRAFQQTLTLTDHQVLAVMGQPDRDAMMQVGMGESPPKLVCLDRQSGRENWVVTPATVKDLPKNEDEKAIQSLQLSGSPLVVGDDVLCIGRVNRGQGEDCYVLAFDLAHGHYRWSCYIASSGLIVNPFMPQMAGVSPDTTSHLAYASGRVYVLTNLGAVAALDAYNGTIVWLDIYPTNRPAMNPMQAMRGFNQIQGATNKPLLKPWMSNAVIVHEGRVFVLPSEGNNLLIYDAGSGREEKRIDLEQLAHWDVPPGGPTGQETDAKFPVDKPTAMLGVVGDQLVLAGQYRVLCMDWRQYDRDRFATAGDQMFYWAEYWPNGILGRPFLTSDAVYIPSAAKLVWMSKQHGNADGTYPRKGVWEDEGAAPGNILETGDHVVVAGSNSVDIYTDLNVAIAKLNREMMAAPNSAEPRLRYAEIMYSAARTDDALARLDEAIGLIGGTEGLARAGPSVDRERAFNDALSFALRTDAGERDLAARDRADHFFDRAAAAAFAPQQQVNLRLARAKFEEEGKDLPQALRLYQQILSDPTFRAVSLVEKDELPHQAQDVAAREIDRLIHAHGTEIYAEYESAAAAAFDEARGGEGNPRQRAGRLLEIAQTYPNSDVSARAMQTAADEYEQAGAARDAIRVLREMWFKYTQPGHGTPAASRVQIAESLARDYLALSDGHQEGRIAVAAARLAQAAQLPGDPNLSREMKLPDGRVLPAGTPFTEALEQVRALHTKELAATLPDFHLPAGTPDWHHKLDQVVPFANQGKNDRVVPPTGADVLPGVTALIPAAPHLGRTDRIVGFGNGIITIFAVKSGGPAAPLCTCNALAGEAAAARPPLGVAWNGETALLWWGSQLLNIDSATGKPLWRIDLSGLGALDVVRGSDVAAAPAEPVNGAVFRGPNGVFIRRNVGGGALVIRGNLVAAQPPAVQPAPQPPAAETASEQVAECRLVGDRVIVATTTGRLLAADLGSGQVCWQTRLAEHAPDHLAVTEDFTVAKVSDDLTARIFTLDTYSGRIIGNKGFSLQQNNGYAQAPVNLALSPDGTLVYTMPDRLCLKDLYKPWSDDERVISAPSGQAPYLSASQPGQLLVSDGRILALADNAPPENSNIKWVCVHSLETGQPIKLKYVAADGTHKEMDCILTTEAKDWSVQLLLVGPSLYLMSPGSLNHYNLDVPQDSWASMYKAWNGDNVSDPPNYQQCLIGQHDLVAICQPTDAPMSAGGSPTQVRLVAMSRRTALTGQKVERESGRIHFVVTLSDPSGILSGWQACEGGLVYATGDGKVHFLRGSAE